MAAAGLWRPGHPPVQPRRAKAVRSRTLVGGSSASGLEDDRAGGGTAVVRWHVSRAPRKSRLRASGLSLHWHTGPVIADLMLHKNQGTYVPARLWFASPRTRTRSS